MSKIKVGIIGFGLSGKTFHASLLKAHPAYEIKMVCTSRSDEVKHTLPEAKIVDRPDSVITAKDIDLIINCAPNAFHYSYTAAAIEAGKHVVVEKPFVNSMSEGQQLIALAKMNKKMISVFHNRRWDADFLTVKKLLASGQLGSIKQFESHMDRWRPTQRNERWKEQALEGSGSFYDLGPHLIDQVVLLFGSPEKLMADISIQKDQGLSDDYFHLIFYYGKMRVLLHSSSFSTLSPRFQIFGDQKNFIKFGLDPQEDQLRKNLSPVQSLFGIDNEELYGKIINPNDSKTEIIPSEKGHYLAYYDGLAKALTNMDPLALPVAAEDALKIIELMELARKSSQTGTVISLN